MANDLLRLWMQQAGLSSYRELAQKSNIGLSTVQRLRKNQADQILPSKLQALAQTLQRRPIELLQAFSTLVWEAEDNWQHEYERLAQQLKAQPQQLQKKFQQETYQQLEALLLQFPTAHYLAQQHPETSAHKVTPLFVSLEQLLTRWDVMTIGCVGKQVPFDPQQHQSSETLSLGELVYVRFVGYRTAERLLQRARVSKTSPVAPKL